MSETHVFLRESCAPKPHLEVSSNGGTPKSPNLNKMFHETNYPFLGPLLWKPPFVAPSKYIPILGNLPPTRASLEIIPEVGVDLSRGWNRFAFKTTFKYPNSPFSAIWILKNIPLLVFRRPSLCIATLGQSFQLVAGRTCLYSESRFIPFIPRLYPHLRISRDVGWSYNSSATGQQRLRPAQVRLIRLAAAVHLAIGFPRWFKSKSRKVFMVQGWRLQEGGRSVVWRRLTLKSTAAIKIYPPSIHLFACFKLHLNHITSLLGGPFCRGTDVFSVLRRVWGLLFLFGVCGGSAAATVFVPPFSLLLAEICQLLAFLGAWWYIGTGWYGPFFDQ